MSCIVRNNNGKVQEVTVDGKPSQLFAQIEAIPFMKDREQAADYYAYVKSRKNLELNVQKEPILVFKPIDSDLVFEESYAAAKQKDVNNSGVSVGVLKTTDKKQEIISTALPTDILDAEFEAQFEETTQDILIANYPDGSKRYGVNKAAKYNEIDSFKTNYAPNSLAGFISRLQNSGINLSNRETVNQVLEFPDAETATPTQEEAPKNLLNSLIDRLKQTGLANKVTQLNTAGIIDKLKNLGVSDDIVKQVEVWHGSPYNFKKFSLEHLGKGEGVQAFGWGLYFTDLKDIAKSYADVLSKREQGEVVSTKDIEEYELSDAAINDLKYSIFRISDFNPNKTQEDYIKYAKNLREAYLQQLNKTPDDIFYKQQFESYDKIVPLLESGEIRVKNRKGKLYKTSIHKGKTPNQYDWLEWDKQPSSKVFSVLQDILSKNDFGDWTKILDKNSSTNGGSFYKNLADALYDKKAKELGYKPTKEEFNKNKEASLFLLKNGIDGIKYPAESISHGATSDTARGFNYVVFDENAVTIEEVIQFQKAGLTLTPQGYYNRNTGEIVINTEAIDPINTSIHEFGHAFMNLLKDQANDKYKAGLSLVDKNEGEAQYYVDYVKNTQPNLKEGSDTFNEEVLAQMIGDNGAKLVKSKNLKNWLQELWQEIKNLLGITDYTAEQISNMSLQEFSTAANVDLFRGEDLNLNDTNVIESNGAKIYFRQRKNPITGNNENMVELELIEVPQDQRGQGAARLAMTNFLEYTDNLGTDVYLIASPRDKQTDLNQLIGFYRSLGFQSTPFFNEEMIRKAPNKKSYINQNINEDLLINSLIQDGTIEANCRL